MSNEPKYTGKFTPSECFALMRGFDYAKSHSEFVEDLELAQLITRLEEYIKRFLLINGYIAHGQLVNSQAGAGKIDGRNSRNPTQDDFAALDAELAELDARLKMNSLP